MTPRLSRYRRRLASLLVGLVLSGTSPTPGMANSMALHVDPGEAWATMEEALRTLESGTPLEKRDLVDEHDDLLGPLFKPHPDHDDQDVETVIDRVRTLIRTEKDDWVTTRILDDLIFHDEKFLQPLFVDALKSLSPNLRWCAIRWFSYGEREDVLVDLEFAWRQEDRPWVRVDLIGALASQGAQQHLNEFMDLVRGDDVDLAVAAIDALASWPDDPDALASVLRASRSEDSAIRNAATRKLGFFATPAASARLIDVALAGADLSTRASAIEALRDVDPKVSVPTLVRVLHQPAIEGGAYLQGLAIQKLMDIDDPTTLDALSDLQAAGDGFPSDDLSTLRASLGRDRASRGTTTIISSACWMSGPVRDPRDPRMLAVNPPPGLQSIRCWQDPGVAGDPHDFPRLPAGFPIRIADHFEYDGESWIQIDGGSIGGCWVPLRFIEHPAGPPAGSDKEDDMLIRIELDIPADEAESDVAQGLMEAGLLEVIDPGDEVVGVAISLDPEDFDQVLLLARSCGLNETMLDAAIDEIVRKAAPLYPERPVLDRFRRTPPAPSADTDQVIDLEIKELTDQ